MALLARLKAAGTALVTNPSGWSSKLLGKVFPQQNVAKLADEDVKKIDEGINSKSKTNFFKLPNWKKTKGVDLTQATRLPENYENPPKLRVLRLHHSESTKSDGILADPKIKTNINPSEPVQVQFVITKKEIFDSLQNDPKSLTPQMAQVLVGKVDSVKGLSPRDIAGALQRIEEKYQGDQRYMPSVKVKEILLDSVLNSNAPESLKETVKSYKSILQDTKYEAQAKNPIPNPLVNEVLTKTNKAINQELAEIKRELTDSANFSGVILTDVELNNAAKYIFQAAKNCITRNAKAGIKLTKDQKYEIMKSEYSKIGAALVAKVGSQEDQKRVSTAFDALALRSLARIETMYEGGGNSQSRNYERITRAVVEDHQSNGKIKLNQIKLQSSNSATNNYNFQTAVEEGIKSIPKQLINYIADNGTKLQSAPSMAFLGYKGAIDGDFYNRSHENMPGLYDREKDLVSIAEERVNRKTGQIERMAKEKVQAVVRHELGHAFRNAIKQNDSYAELIRTAYTNDSQRLKSLHPDIQKDMEYQAQAKGGEDEAFANAFAVMFGGDGSTKAFRFSKLEAVIKKISNEIIRNSSHNLPQIPQGFVKHNILEQALQAA